MGNKCGSDKEKSKENGDNKEGLQESGSKIKEENPNINGNMMNDNNFSPEKNNGNYNNTNNDLQGSVNNYNNNYNNTNMNDNNFNDNNNNFNDNNNNFNDNNNNLNDNNNNNYYIICPDCLIRSPHVEKIYYDDDNKDFLVKFTCICQDNPRHAKKIPLQNIITTREPSNTCNIHPNNKLVIFCKDCHRAICSQCKHELHVGHYLENDFNNNLSKEGADNMLEMIRKKEQQFNNEVNENEQKMENGFDNMIQKLNNDKMNYKRQLENYKGNNKKTFEFLKNLYGRYINNCDTNENNYNPNNFSPSSHNDVMLTNHINKFSIDNKKMPKFNSNVDEILDQYNEEQKELKLKYDYGFPFKKKKTKSKDKKVSKYKRKSNEINSHFTKKKEFVCIKSFKGHKEKIVSLLQLSSGRIASGSYDNTIRIWDIDSVTEDCVIHETGRVFALLEYERDKLLSGTSDNVINLWDLRSSSDEPLFSFTGHELWINCLIKINNYYFASASNDAKIKIWDYYDRKCLYDLSGHKDCILTLILLKNKYLCSGGADLSIKIWDWEKRNCIRELRGHRKWVKCLFELDNGLLLSGSDDKTIKIWRDFDLLATLEGHRHSVRTFCQVNENYFASGSFDCTIKVWNINTLECIQTILGHNSNIICIISIIMDDVRSNRYNYIASCSNDKLIKLWEGIL